jgi:lysophospholipase L1-like esterase
MLRTLIPTLITLLASAPAIADTPDLAGRRVLVLGDSITQHGGYVSNLEYYLRTSGKACDLVSIGLSSETISGLREASSAFPRPCVHERLDRALQALRPEIVIACYGMNDGIFRPPSPENRAAFTAGLQRLIEKIRAAGAHLVLVTPPIFDPQPLAGKTRPLGAESYSYQNIYTGYDDNLVEFSRIVMALREPDVTVIDLHTPMAAALATRRQKDPNFSFASDGVHPGDLGHVVMSQIIARGLGLDVPQDSEALLARLQADPIHELVHERRQLRSEAWLAFVGYTREATFKSPSVAAAEKVAARLDAQIAARLSR